MGGRESLEWFLGMVGGLYITRVCLFIKDHLFRLYILVWPFGVA
jgi:hypothetical protein